MKAIFVQSLNGYTAKSKQDNMFWTGEMDKKLFKLLSFSLGGVCICSKNTYDLLPLMMKKGRRTFIVAERQGENSLTNLNKLYPNGVLVGGTNFLYEAYKLGIVDTFIVSTLSKEIQGEYKNPFTEILKKPACAVNFDELTVHVYYTKDQNEK